MAAQCLSQTIGQCRRAGFDWLISQVMFQVAGQAGQPIGLSGQLRAGLDRPAARRLGPLLGVFSSHHEQLDRPLHGRGLRQPVEDNREVQSVLDAHGRILGWFSWEPQNAMSAALGELQPLAILTAILLVSFAGLALWQVRKTVRELGASEQLAWQLAHEDMLTGLPNHRKMIEQIDAVVAQRAHGDVATLAFLDLDGLKQINDTYGHQEGNRALVETANLLRDSFRQSDNVKRFK